jgi:hypothetical protein
MPPIVVCDLSGSIMFLTLSHKKYDFFFLKKSLNMKCVFSFFLQLLFKRFLILRRIQPDVINAKSLHVYYPLFLSDFNET